MEAGEEQKQGRRIGSAEWREGEMDEMTDGGTRDVACACEVPWDWLKLLAVITVVWFNI